MLLWKSWRSDTCSEHVWWGYIGILKQSLDNNLTNVCSPYFPLEAVISRHWIRSNDFSRLLLSLFRCCCWLIILLHSPSYFTIHWFQLTCQTTYWGTCFRKALRCKKFSKIVIIWQLQLAKMEMGCNFKLNGLIVAFSSWTLLSWFQGPTFS